MDKTKTKLAAFFNADEDEESTSFPQLALDDQKLTQYTHGTVRKSKREKEKEKEEQKRKEQEDLAAKTYAEFLDAFEGEGTQRKGSGFVRAGGSSRDDVYDLRARERESRSQSGREEREPHPRSASPSASAPKPKGKRAMDAFLEEIKRDQAQLEEKFSRNSRAQGRSVTALAAYESQSGSKDRGDPLTSNVFVANLPSHISEVALGNFFASRCGPVGSVKVMWPRGDASHGPGADMNASRSKKSSGLSGFVSFMERRDAETAVREIDGYEWGGSVLRVGWSKAVPLAAKATYVADRQARSRSRSRSYERRDTGSLRDRRRSRSYSRDRRHKNSDDRYRKYSRSYSRSRSRSRSPMQRSRGYARKYSRSRSRSPRSRRASPFDRSRTGVDPDTESFIETVALKVKENGDKFEDMLRERERQNPKFKFLFDTSTPENRLYRSLIVGKALVVGFDDEGYNSVYSTDSAEESEREWVKKQKLGKLARRRFEAMLRGMTGKRGEVARCMAFSLEHAEAASEVTDIIVASLLVDSTAVPRKVARLHLICDILHNSAAAVPNAWKFRQEFQSRLGIVFDHLSSIYHSFPGRITAETFKKQIMAVVDVWEDWIVFPPDYIATLKSRLDGTTEAEKSEANETTVDTEEEKASFAAKFKASSFKPAETVDTAPVAGQQDEDGEADMDMDDSDGEKGEGADVDGEPLDDDVDGIPIDDVDGVPLDDVDGEPMEDVDGEPIDGEPFDGPRFDDVEGEPL